MPKKFTIAKTVSEDTVEFSLTVEDGELYLYANGQSILSLTEEGKVELHEGVSKDYGFKLDEDGQLLIA